MDTVPTEIKWKLLLILNLQQLGRMCRVSKEFQDICNDENFWKDKLAQDFDWKMDRPLSQGMTYREQYKTLHELGDFGRRFLLAIQNDAHFITTPPTKETIKEYYQLLKEKKVFYIIDTSKPLKVRKNGTGDYHLIYKERSISVGVSKLYYLTPNLWEFVISYAVPPTRYDPLFKGTLSIRTSDLYPVLKKLYDNGYIIVTPGDIDQTTIVRGIELDVFHLE